MTVAGALRALPYGFDEAGLPPKADDRDITAPARSVNIIQIVKYISYAGQQVLKDEVVNKPRKRLVLGMGLLMRKPRDLSAGRSR
ncbi:hypothetical protein [Mesorhizobium sp. BH1-1-4]|uniref:hypothetical protein n=1 Tax=Mesorhizobium sp. BH1-1-4 TaxID=2876662 RepID=UPI001CD066DC|nr:hypothetical protein [Mesorhizobium sp. BH1-1-4]MBZ9995239.1 hypothetical protein [Mesorhizobium sp. BH1-1-4]